MTYLAAPPVAPANCNSASNSAGETGESTVLADNIDPLVVPISVNARGLALGILATVALIFALEWAQKFVISLLLGIFISYTLNPLVVWLEKVKLPRVISTTVVMISVLSGLLYGGYSLRGQIQTIIEQLPQAAKQFSAALATGLRDGHFSSMQKMQKAASEIEKATNQTVGGPPAPKQGASHLIVDQPVFTLSNLLWRGSMSVLDFLGQAIMVFFLIFFLLLTGDTFKRKLVRLTGPSLSRKKITVHILDDINSSIQNYMFMLLVTNGLLSLLTWIAFRAMGLENAGAWAVAAGLLHIIPYFGPLLTAMTSGTAAFMQFDSFSQALLISGASLAIATLVGTIVATWMAGKIAQMNAAAMFVSLLFWAWLWGIWGMLLGIPIIVIVKVVAERIEQLQPLAELLGE